MSEMGRNLSNITAERLRPIWHDFQKPAVTAGMHHSQRLPAPHAAVGANLICVRAAQAFPRAWVMFEVPGPRHHPPRAGDACILPCATLLCVHPALLSPLRQRRPQPHELTGACRLRGSSLPCSCCPCLVQFLESASLFKSPVFERTASRRHCRRTAN